MLGVLLLGLYLAQPQMLQTVVRDSAGFLCAAAIVVALRRYRPARPAAWAVLATGVVVLGLADVAATVGKAGTPTAPFPSLADGLYLTAYATLVAALWLVERRSKARDVTAWQDAATWAVAGVLLGYEWLREPLLAQYDGSPAAAVVVVAYPGLAVVLLVLLVRLVAGRAGPRRVRWGLALSLGAYLASDALYVLLDFPGGTTSAVVGLGWIACFIGIAVTALHPSMVDLGGPLTPPSGSRGDRRHGLLIGVALLSPAVAAWHDWGTGGDDLAIIVAGALVLLMLTSLRGAGLLRKLAGLAEELQGREQELEHLATRDALTGLANRRVLQHQLLGRASGDEPFCVALIDLDDFKLVNDELGHDVGDELLVAVAGCLRTGLGPEALVCRLGGDEFAVLAGGPPEALAARLSDCLLSCTSPDPSVPVRASVGICASPPGTDGAVLLRRADLAMYVAKRAGGDGLRIYEPSMSHDAAAEPDRRDSIARALDAGELTAWFQPVVQLDTGRLVGVEAMVRWDRSELAPEPSPDWYATAERSDLVVAVDLQVLALAARQLSRWSRESSFAAALELSLDISVRSLREPDIAERVLAVLQREGLAPGRLVLEIAGATRLDESLVVRLQRLREAGVRIALEDPVGNGWSLLASLEHQPVDRLKLGRSFLAGLEDVGVARVLPAAVLQLAAELGLDVVAEGVATRSDAEVLLGMGLRSGQGRLFGLPAPATELALDGWLPVVPRPRSAPARLEPVARELRLDEAAGQAASAPARTGLGPCD